jgi:hypothetical protein
MTLVDLLSLADECFEADAILKSVRKRDAGTGGTEKEATYLLRLDGEMKRLTEAVPVLLEELKEVDPSHALDMIRVVNVFLSYDHIRASGMGQAIIASVQRVAQSILAANEHDIYDEVCAWLRVNCNEILSLKTPNSTEILELLSESQISERQLCDSIECVSSEVLAMGLDHLSSEGSSSTWPYLLEKYFGELSRSKGH